MANKNEISIDMVMDIKDFEDQLKKAETTARDTWAKIDSALVVKMRLNIDDIEQKIKAAKLQLKTMDQDSIEARKLRLDISQYKTNLTEAKRQLNNYVNTWDTALSRLQKKFNQISDKMWGTSTIWWKAFAWMSEWIWNVSNLAWWLISKLWLVAVALWAIKVWAAALNLWDKLEQATISFETMLWSWEAAKNLLADLATFAASTPFELIWLRDTTKQLLAFWIESDQIIPTLKALWDVSAWLSVPIEQVAYAYWQVRVAWRLMWWELMQFTNAWVPLLAELSKNLWYTQKEIKDMVSEWKISFADVQNAFKTMSSEGWKFADMMWKQSETLSWKWSNFKDNVNSMLESLWTALIPYAKKVVDAMNFWLVGLKKIFMWFQLMFYDFVWQIVQATYAIQIWWIKVTWWIAIVLNWMIWSFKDFYENTKILASNVWTAFWTVPWKIAEFLNKWITKLEDFLNKASNWINNFAKKLWFEWDVVWKVSIWKLDTSWATTQYKDFIQTNRNLSSQINAWILSNMDTQIAAIKVEKDNHSKYLQDSLNEMVLNFDKKKELNTDLADLQSDLQNKDLDNNKKWAASKKKTAEELQKELEKQQEEAKKAELERQITLLNERAKNEIDSVKKSELTELEKAKAIIKINEDLDKAVNQLKQDSNKTELDLAKEIVKAEEEKNKKIKDWQKIVQDYYQEVAKWSEAAIWKIEDLKKQIEDLNKELATETEWKNKDIAERKLEILEREKEIQKELNKLKQEWINLDLAKSLDNTFFEQVWEWATIWNNSVSDYEKAKQLQEELAKLQEENILNTANLDQTTFDEVQAYKNMSKTEQILYDFEKTKEWIEVEKQAVLDSLKIQEEEYKKISKIKEHLEKQFTEFLKIETDSRVTELNRIKQAALEAAAALRSAWVKTSELSSWTSNSTNSSSTVVNQTNNFTAKVTKDDVKTISNEIAKNVSNAKTWIK